MKNQQQEQAKELYFQSGMSKTDIAGKLGVNRRTIYAWAQEGNWDALRKSAAHMPAILAEKVYYLIGHLTDGILKRDCSSEPITKSEVDMLAKLTNTVIKLRKGSTVNENMETFTHLLEKIGKTDIALAEQLVPHISDYVGNQSSTSLTSFPLQGHNPDGSLPHFSEDTLEKWADEEDAKALREEAEQQAATAKPHDTTTTPAPAAPLPPTHAFSPAAPSSTSADLERILGKKAMAGVVHHQPAHSFRRPQAA